MGYDYRVLRELASEPARRAQLRGRLMRPYRRRRFRAFGAGSVVHRPLWIYGPQHIAIGAEVLILHQAWLSVETPAWRRGGAVLSIGDRVAIRPYCTISASESVVIEDDVIVGASGAQVLSGSAPKTVRDIETLMAEG